jgi:hypothetical protein
MSDLGIGFLRRLVAGALTAAIVSAISAEPLSAQSVADKIRAQMEARAKGMGNAERQACRNDVAKKLGDSKLKLVDFRQEFDLVTYIQAGGWPGRTGKPRYQSTLVIMRTAYARDGANMFFGKGKAVCIYNREGGGLRFIVSCFPGRDLCRLPD